MIKIRLVDGIETRRSRPMTGGGRGFSTGFIGHSQLPLLPPMYLFPPMHSPLTQHQSSLPHPSPFRTLTAAPQAIPMLPALPNLIGHNVSAEEEIKLLEDQVTSLKHQLESTRRRILKLDE